MTIHSVLFVSSGNVLRGPIAEAMMRQALSHVPHALSIGSAGLDALEGQAVDPHVLSVAREFSVPLDSHRATRLTDEMVHGADFIVAIGAREHAELLRRYPNLRRVTLVEIAEPASSTPSDVALCCELLRNSVRQQAARLFPELARIQRRPR